MSQNLLASEIIKTISPLLSEETQTSKIFKTIDQELIQQFKVKDELIEELQQYISPLIINLEESDTFESQQAALNTFETHLKLISLPPTNVKIALIALMKLAKLQHRFHAVAYAFLTREPAALDRALLSGLAKLQLVNCQYIIHEYFSVVQKTPNQLYLLLLQQIIQNFCSQQKYFEAYQFFRKQNSIFYILLKQIEAPVDTIYQIALLHAICGEIDIANDLLRSVESDDIKFQRLELLLNILMFEPTEYNSESADFDSFFVVLNNYYQTSQLAFLDDSRKTSYQQLAEVIDEYKRELIQENFYSIVMQIVTKTHQFGLKMNLAKKVYSAVPIGFFDGSVQRDVLQTQGADQSGEIVYLENKQQTYSTLRPRRTIRGLLKRIDAQRVIALKNVKNEQIEESGEISNDGDEDFFTFDFEDFE